MVIENEDGQELESRSYFAIGAVLGLSSSIGLALLVFIIIATASSVKDAISPPSPVPAAAAAGDTTSQTDTGTVADDSSTDDGTTDAGSGDSEDSEASLVATGADLATSKGCVACHSTNGNNGVGPTWSGLSGSERSLDDGSMVTADDGYLLDSIIDPGAKIVEGFAPIMPTSFGDSLSQEELDSLIAYIKSV